MRIVNFGQLVAVSDDGPAIQHQFTLQLPSGELHSVLTDESTIAQLVDMVSVASEHLPEPEPQIEHDPGEVNVSMDPEAVMGVLATEPASEELSGSGLGQPKRPPVDSDGFYMAPKARTVPKDELGYPIVHTAGRAVSPLPPEDEGDGTQI